VTEQQDSFMPTKGADQMRHHGGRWMIVALIVACLGAAACTESSVAGTDKNKAEPATVEQVSPNEARLTLTEDAARRLDLKTGTITQTQVTRDGKTTKRRVIPYAAVIYDPEGKTSAYTSPEPLKYVRQAISIDFIDGDRAVLTDGPPDGTAVVTVGAAELYGVETGVGH